MQNYGSEECPVTQLWLWGMPCHPALPLHVGSCAHSLLSSSHNQAAAMPWRCPELPTSLPVLLLPSLPGIVSPDQSVDLTSNTVSFIRKSCILFCSVQCFIAPASSRSALCLSLHLRIFCLERLPCTSWWLLSFILLPFCVLLQYPACNVTQRTAGTWWLYSGKTYDQQNQWTASLDQELLCLSLLVRQTSQRSTWSCISLGSIMFGGQK